MLHTGNIYSCSKCLKLQKFAFHFLRQCLYADLPTSLKESASVQFVADKSASWLYSMLWSFNAFFTIFTVSLSGNRFRYAT